MRSFPDRRFRILSPRRAHAKPCQERRQTRIEDTPPPTRAYSTNTVMGESLGIVEGAELLFDVCSSVSFQRQEYKHKCNNGFRRLRTKAENFHFTPLSIMVDDFPSTFSTYSGLLNGCFLFISVYIRQIGHIRKIEQAISFE